MGKDRPVESRNGFVCGSSCLESIEFPAFLGQSMGQWVLLHLSSLSEKVPTAYLGSFASVPVPG